VAKAFVVAKLDRSTSCWAAVRLSTSCGRATCDLMNWSIEMEISAAPMAAMMVAPAIAVPTTKTASASVAPAASSAPVSKTSSISVDAAE
jgi:hypothetical protein